MTNKTIHPGFNRFNLLMYVLFMLSGAIILFLCSFIQQTPENIEGEYYYSGFFRNNYTLLSAVLLFVAALFAGYYFKLNPWWTGISFLMALPVIAIIEGFVFRGSHNLIPFELAIYFAMMLPCVLAAYIGRFARKKKDQRKHSV